MAGWHPSVFSNLEIKMLYGGRRALKLVFAALLEFPCVVCLVIMSIAMYTL